MVHADRTAVRQTACLHAAVGGSHLGAELPRVVADGMLGTGAAHGVVGMALLALAWSVHAGRQRHEAWTTQPAGATVLVLSALSGPALLLAVGWLSPTSGPWAQQLAYGLIGGTALLALIFTGWRTALPGSHPLPFARSDSA